MFHFYLRRRFVVAVSSTLFVIMVVSIFMLPGTAFARRPTRPLTAGRDAPACIDTGPSGIKQRKIIRHCSALVGLEDSSVDKSRHLHLRRHLSRNRDRWDKDLNRNRMRHKTHGSFASVEVPAMECQVGTQESLFRHSMTM